MVHVFFVDCYAPRYNSYVPLLLDVVFCVLGMIQFPKLYMLLGIRHNGSVQKPCLGINFVDHGGSPSMVNATLCAYYICNVSTQVLCATLVCAHRYVPIMCYLLLKLSIIFCCVLLQENQVKFDKN